MRCSTSLFLTAAAAASLAYATPTLTGGAAKRFEPSAPSTCFYTCPDLADGTTGVDDGVPTPADGAGFPAGWAYVPGGTIVDPFDRSLEYFADGQDFANSYMTNQFCADLCARNNYRLSGTQYSYQCFCGNDLQNGASFSNKGGNTMLCSGDGSQVCGGAYVNTVSYNKNNVAPGVTDYLATLTQCTYDGTTSADCVYTSSTGELQIQQPATCPAQADASSQCSSGQSAKRQFARSLTPLERKIKARQFSFKKAPAPRRAPTTGGGPAWLNKR